VIHVRFRKAFSAIDTLVAGGRSRIRKLLGEESSADRFVPFQSRLWATDLALSRQFLRKVQEAKWGGQEPLIHWKGIPNIKDPYDLALVPLLLGELKPATVIELGSYLGGSAIWMADLLQAMSIDSRIYSFDLNVSRIKASHPRVEFFKGDCNDPSTLTVPELENLPRPWLLIEDAHVNTFNVLKHFHPYLKVGDYLIVEDTAFILEKYRQLARFMKEYPEAYRVDRRYADLFGYNATFSFNGYLKRVQA
jgi:cephalosporin hydroxylase